MRRSILMMLTVAGVAACGSRSTTDSKAPALDPAIIQVPGAPDLSSPPITQAKKPPVVLSDPVRRGMAISQGYALVTAMMANEDVRMLSQLYATNAVLTMPESTVIGSLAVARHLVALAKTKSLTEFERESQGVQILDDSTLIDSGTYRIKLQRSPKDSALENGRYSAKWRARRNIDDWIILEDRIVPARTTKKGLSK